MLRKSIGQFRERSDIPLQVRYATDVRAVPGLKAAREGKLMTQEDLAGATKINRVTISRLETGYEKARFSTIKRLAKALKVDAAVLMEGTKA